MERKFNVLVVDDDEDDQFLIRQAFEDESIAYELHFAYDGTDVLENIQRPMPLPDLILLDLNMPRIGGFEVLSHLKNSPLYRHVPVIILSTSNNPSDIEKAYQLGANSYVVKPNSHKKLTKMAKKIRKYWFVLSELPSRRSN
jgi:CheY-like chemotaxis protein